MSDDQRRWTIFLDRDGVLNRKAPPHQYITRPEDFVWLPGVLESLRRLHDAGAYLFVTTNQQGIAKGIMSEGDVAEIHDLMQAEASRAGAPIDRVYTCPHRAGTCDCRKPGIGLFERARHDFPQINFSRSVVAGDAESDIAAGKQIGARTIFIQRTGAFPVRNADAVANSLPDAVDRWILKWI